MTVSSPSIIRILTTMIVLSVALIASLSVSAGSAFAAGCYEEIECEIPTPDASTVPDACPDMAGMQTSSTECVAPTPPAPTPVVEPTPAPAAPPVPDEGYVAPAPAEFDHDSLTLETAQDDPDTVSGTEVTIPASNAEASATGSGASSAVAAIPAGPLPYTGSVTTNVAILGVLLLWIGVLGYFTAFLSSRRSVKTSIDNA